MTEPAPISVLLVEDDDVAAEAVERSLKRQGLPVQITWARDGVEGLEALRASVRRPRVILLDLNMPRMNGFEFLDALRADPKLKDNVVFVLTTSDAEGDRARAYDHHVAGYMVKTRLGPRFQVLCDLLRSYAHGVVLP